MLVFESMLQKVKSHRLAVPNSSISIHASMGNFLIWGIYFLIQTVLKHADFYWMKKVFS